jgi:hypothetical protein
LRCIRCPARRRIGHKPPAAAALRPAAASARNDAPGTRTNALAFQVSRNGAPIGTHRLSFSRHGAELAVRIDAAFRVGFGFITFYRYRHSGVERWRDGRFESSKPPRTTMAGYSGLKTFALLPQTRRQRTQRNKSFLVLFFKKELLLFPTRNPSTTAPTAYPPPASHTHAADAA